MLKHIVLFSGIVFLLFLVFIYLFQRNLIYFPAKEEPNRKNFDAEDMQVIKLTTSDRLNLNAWYKPSRINKPTILYFHGNAGHIGYRMYLAREFISQGFGVLLLDYRGYGGNPGSPTEDGLYRDGRAAKHFLQAQNIQNHHIIFYGESLGTGVAIKLASEFSVCAVILQSPYTSLTALARYHYPWIFIPPKDQYNSLGLIKKINSPILFLHGKQDEIVPYDQGLALYNNANKPKEWVEFTNKGHANLWDIEFVETINGFINRMSSACLEK